MVPNQGEFCEITHLTQADFLECNSTAIFEQTSFAIYASILVVYQTKHLGNGPLEGRHHGFFYFFIAEPSEHESIVGHL